MRRALRIGLLGLGGIVVVPLLALLAGYVFMQTESGKQWLAQTLSYQLSTSDMSIAVTGVTGSPPFDLHVAAIDLADRGGRWAEVRDAQLLIAGQSLLHGELAIQHVRAASVD